MKEQKFPIYYAGSKSFFSVIPEFKIQTTLMIPQPCVLSIQPEFISIFQKGFLEPILTLILIGEEARELITKNGLRGFNENTIYIYYPYQLRVDESIYKMRVNSYESMLKEISRSQREYFTRLLLWQQGRGENLIQNQVQKIFNLIGKELKISIQKRVLGLLDEQKKIDNQSANYNKIVRSHILKSKICKIYDYLKLYHWITPILQEQYKSIWIGMQFFQTVQLYRNRSTVINPGQCTTQDVAKLIQDDRIYFIELITHSFYELFSHLAKTMKLLQALQFLKDFIMMIQSHIFKIGINCSQTPQIQHLFQNLWFIQLIQNALLLITQSRNLLIQSKKNDFDVLYYSLKMIVRYKFEQVGLVLFKFDPIVFSFRGIEDQLCDFFKILNKSTLDQNIIFQPTNIINQQQQYLKLIENQPLRQALFKYSSYVNFYLQYIQQVYFAIKDSKLKRIQFGLRLMLLKAKVKYPKVVSSKILTLIEQIRIGQWESLQLLSDLYSTLVCIQYKYAQQFLEHISLLFRNKTLSKINRLKLLQFVSLHYETQSPKDQIRINSYLAVINSLKVRQIGQKYCKYEFQLQLQTYFDLQQCISQFLIIFNLKNSNGQQKQIKPIFKIKQKSKNIWRGKFQYFCQTSCFLYIKNSQIKFATNIIFPVVISQEVRKNIISLNETKIKEGWPLVSNIIYKQLPTPIEIILSNVPNCLKFKFCIITNQLICMTKGQLNQQQIQIKQIGQYTQINLKQKGSSKIKLLLYLVAKQDEAQSLAFSFFPLKLIFDNNQVNYKVKFKVNQTIQITYFNGDKLGNYKIQNISDKLIQIQTLKQNVCLKKNEQMNVRKSKIKIGFKNYMLRTLELKEYAKNKEQIMEIKGTFALRINQLNFKLFEQIKIQSQIVGNLKIVAFQGYQMLGKIKGLLEYQQDSKIINLSILPVKVGQIVLPQIYIEGKKGEWKNPIIIDICSQ